MKLGEGVANESEDGSHGDQRKVQEEKIYEECASVGSKAREKVHGCSKLSELYKEERQVDESLSPWQNQFAARTWYKKTYRTTIAG